jgi:hypothetical protein
LIWFCKQFRNSLGTGHAGRFARTDQRDKGLQSQPLWLDDCSVEWRFSLGIHIRFASRFIAPSPWNSFSQKFSVGGVEPEPRLMVIYAHPLEKVYSGPGGYRTQFSAMFQVWLEPSKAR